MFKPYQTSLAMAVLILKHIAVKFLSDET